MRATIAPWQRGDLDAVIELIVGIQRGEFDLPITAGDQPDLADVAGAYQQTGGEFFVARDGDRVVGTIAALVVEENTVALRKMFVDASQRGTGLASALVDTLVGWCRRQGYRTILLGTTDRMAAAHRFYAKHGFVPIDRHALPSGFPVMAVDSVFLRRDLPGVVVIRPSNPEWPRMFERVRGRVAGALGSAAILVEHVGSTSVPGLPAQPVIDVVLTVTDSRAEDAYVPPLEAVGFAFNHREPEWFEHRLLNADWPRVNLHVFTDGCDEVARMLRFRDHLRRDADDRERYAMVKRELATRTWTIVQDYADAKTEIVAEIMSRA